MLSGPNERLSQNDHSNEELASSGYSVVLSSRKYKGKMKMSEYGTDKSMAQTEVHWIRENLTPTEAKTDLRS